MITSQMGDGLGQNGRRRIQCGPLISSNGAIFYKTSHRRGQDEDYAVTGFSPQHFLGITINIMLSFFVSEKCRRVLFL